LSYIPTAIGCMAGMVFNGAMTVRSSNNSKFCSFR
jgi:hypothetical protein